MNAVSAIDLIARVMPAARALARAWKPGRNGELMPSSGVQVEANRDLDTLAPTNELSGFSLALANLLPTSR